MVVVNDMAARMKQKQYETSVCDYFNNKGSVIVVSDDNTFLSVVRIVLFKHLALIQPDLLTSITEPAQLIRVVREAHDSGKSPVIFVECVLGGRDLSFQVRQIKEAYPHVHIVMLTIEVERQKLMYLHELGVDNFITKPVSANTLIEKLAFTVKPQSKLGQVIDASRALLKQGQPERAKKICEQILEMKPGSAAGLMLLGDAEKALGNLESAKSCYEEASKGSNLYLEPLHKLAQLAEERGEQDEHLSYLEKLDKLSPLNPERKVSMGEIHLSKGNTQQAEALFETAVAQVTKEAYAQIASISNKIASVYAETDPEKSEAFLRRALAAKGNYLSRDDIRTFNQLGISLRKQGRWQDAIVEYKKALRIAPDDENLFYNAAMAYAEGKDFREARISMLKALELNPDYPRQSLSIAYNMGVVFLQSGAREQCRLCLSIAQEIEPDNPMVLAALIKLG